MNSHEGAKMPGPESRAEAMTGPPKPVLPVSSGGMPSETYQTETVSRLLREAAYFPLFSVHNPNIENVPLPSSRSPNRLIGMKVYEEMHRFDIKVEPPNLDCGLRAVNQLGQPVADIHIDWRVIPDDFVAAPGKLPPPTELDLTRSQRFAMYDGQFNWKDRQGSSFHGFGSGRTFPTIVGGQPQLRIAAVVDIIEGFGKLNGVVGNAVVNGFITPPYNLALNIMLRILDPAKRFKTRSAITNLRPIPDPDPNASFLAFLGEADPDNPITLNIAPDGSVAGASVHELLRILRIDFDVGTSKGMRSQASTGSIVGSLSFNLNINSRDQRIPIPFRTTDAIFTFFDRERRTIGRLAANVVEGRAFMTELEGAPQPVLRVAGFGPCIGGSAQFSGVSGMLSLNGIISIPARTPSICYVLRISDPEGKFRKAWHE